jgi:hypothetical protein
MATTLHPTVLWAQRKDALFLTIDLQDCKVRHDHVPERFNGPSARRFIALLLHPLPQAAGTAN